MRHAIVAGDGAVRGTLDAALEAEGLRRRVVLTLPHFHAVALAVADGAVFAALPVHFARTVAPRLGLELYELGVASPTLNVKMYWHARLRDDPGGRWLRDRVRQVCADIVAREPAGHG